MPILSVTTWPVSDEEKCKEIIEELTKTMHRVTGAPLDRITVFIEEIPKSRWGEGGACGSHPDFAVLSRKPNLSSRSDQG